MSEGRPIIKTYSRRQPVTVFKSAATLIPSHPNPNFNVRESRLNDKTLIVNSFNDTFDKLLAADVKVSSPKNVSNHSDVYNNEKSENLFKIPSPPSKKAKAVKRKNYEIVNQEKLQLNEVNGNTKQQENDHEIIKNKKTGIKRKKSSSDSSDEDFHLVLEEDEEDKAKKSVKQTKRNTRRSVKKKKISPKGEEGVQFKECSIYLERYDTSLDFSEDSLNISAKNSNENSFKLSRKTENLEQSKQFLNIHQLKDSNNFPTSTPRDCRIRKIVDMQNLSPITLDKENKAYGEQYSRFSFIDGKEQQTKEKSILKDSNLNNRTDNRSKEMIEFLKPKSNKVKRAALQSQQTKNTFDNLENETSIVKENVVENKSNISENINEQNDLPSETLSRLSLNITPIMNQQQNENFVDSPLLFDDTQEDKAQSHLNNISFQNKKDEISKNQIQNICKPLSENKEQLINWQESNSKKDLDISYNSSFSPHDWTDDYNSSYEYCTENKIGHKTNYSENNTFGEELNDSCEKADDVELENTLHTISSENTIEEKTNENGLEKTENMIEVNDVIKSQNDILKENGHSNSTNALENMTDDSIINNVYESSTINNKLVENEDNEYLNFKQLEEFSKLNHLSANDKSLNTSEVNLVSKELQKKNNIDIEITATVNGNEENNILNENSIRKNNQSNVDNMENEEKLDITDEEITFKAIEMNKNSNQINNRNETIANLGEKRISEIKEVNKNYKNNEIDERLNGQQLILCISKIDTQDMKNSLNCLTNVSKTEKASKKSENLNQVQNIPNIHIEFENKDSKLEDESAKIISPAVTKKVMKKRIRKITSKPNNVKKKNIKFKNKKNVRNKMNQQDNKTANFDNPEEIDNARSVNEISTIKRNDTPKKLIYKELRVLITRLNISNKENKSLILSRRKLKQRTKKRISRKSESNVSTKGRESIKNSEIDIDIKNNVDTNQENCMISNKSLNISPIKNMTDISEKNKEINNSLNGEELCDILTKLNDPIKITMRRNVHRKWDRPLAAITEDQIEISSNAIEEHDENQEEQIPLINDMKKKSLLEECEVNKCEDDRKSQPIFLKPGKSWARSLSIINHFHSGQNLDEFAVGRGQNWRHSVQAILNMQPEGTHTIFDVKNINDENEIHSHAFLDPNVLQRESNRVSSIITSPTRFSRRFSIRIIPSGKKSILTDDFVNSRTSSFITERTRKTSSTRKTSLKIRRDTLIESEDDLIKSAKEIILKRCKQRSYLPFDVCFPDSYIDHCRKIGEGVYGEVFLYENNTDKSVIKIIPIEGDELVNCEPQKKFHEILSEIIIAEELHKLRFGNEYNTNGFVGVNRIMCVNGKYPDKLIDLWNIYDKEKKSENDSPSMFGDEQLYIILELAHGGQDLEAFVFQNASESYSIFLQTAFTLAVAEQSLEFEHRDLHWGNILISKTEETKSVYKLHDDEISIPIKGVKVSVIDFTLSRMSYQGCKIFNDLAADPTLFTAQGEYQFDIYRMMRDNVNNDWQQFNPFTNVLWLDYTLDKMITAARYKKKTTKVHKTAIDEMKQLRKEILNYKSAFDFVSNCEKVIALTR